MVAYSFKQRFELPIAVGTKRQTIRAERKRHAREGEQLQLYTGMRTKQCRLIGRAICLGTVPVRLDLECGRIEFPATGRALTTIQELNDFARADGFAQWHGRGGLLEFWRVEHGNISVFSGVMIRWDQFCAKGDGQ